MSEYSVVPPVVQYQIQEQPDYEKALELYRRLLREFSKGETRYYDQAQEKIKEITEASMSIAVSNIFLPDSELVFALNARNVRRVDLALYKIDMTRDVHFISSVDEEDGESDPAPWIQRVPTAGRAPVKTWSKNIPDATTHKPFAEQSRIEGKLPVGAYLLEAKSGSLSVRDIVLVSDTTLVLKSSTNQALAFFTNALTGAPIANASVALWESYYLNNRWRWRRVRQTTDAS